MERAGKTTLLFAFCLFVTSQETAAIEDVGLGSVNLPEAEAEGNVLLRKRRSIDSFIDAAIQDNEAWLESPPPAIYLHPEPVVLGPITITCPYGMAKINSVCVPCPPGTKLADSGYCELCPTGTYQDANRTTECLPCETSGKPGMTHCPECIDSCYGLIDGNYQSCSGCGGYAACSNGGLFEMPCPAGLVWDNDVKQCEGTSPTCEEMAKSTDALSSTEGTTTPSSGGGGGDGACVSHCSGYADGDYQACDTCQHYVTCSSGYIYIMPCPGGLVWDDNNKGCGWTSATCTP